MIESERSRIELPFTVTTEKDAVRLPAGFPASVLRLGVTVLEGEETLRHELARPPEAGGK